MTHDRTPEQIAAGLSPAQRRALLWLPENGSSAASGRDTPTDGQMSILSDANLCWTSGSRCFWRLTPLGQAVRAAVLVMQEARDA